MRSSQSKGQNQRFLVRTQHNIIQNDGATRSRQKTKRNQRKVSYLDPSTILRALSLRKELERKKDLRVLPRHPSVRPHPHGRCVCCRGSYPNILTLTFGDREGRPRTLRQPSQKRREGSRRLTVVQRVSQMDPKSETGPNHSYEGSSACSQLGKLIFN